MESLAKQFNHDFDNGDFNIFDKSGNKVYSENIDGFWIKIEYDKNYNLIYYETSNGFWVKRKYDENNNIFYFEDSTGFWVKRKYDENNIMIYYEDSTGKITDNRPKKIITINGKKYKEI